MTHCKHCKSPDPQACGRILWHPSTEIPCACQCHVNQPEQPPEPLPTDDLTTRAGTTFADSRHVVTITFADWRRHIYTEFKSLWGDQPEWDRLVNAHRAAGYGICCTREPYRSWWRQLAEVDLPAVQQEWERRGLL